MAIYVRIFHHQILAGREHLAIDPHFVQYVLFVVVRVKRHH
jgi:hypothetical protein